MSASVPASLALEQAREIERLTDEIRALRELIQEQRVCLGWTLTLLKPGEPLEVSIQRCLEMTP